MNKNEILDIDELLMKDNSKTGVVSKMIIREAIRRGIPMQMTVEMSEEDILKKIENIKRINHGKKS